MKCDRGLQKVAGMPHGWRIWFSCLCGCLAAAALSPWAARAQPTLAEALDAPGLSWSTNGNAGWFAVTDTTHDGADAARSGNIGHGQQSTLQTAVEWPGVVTFWWKVSSEPFDVLSFFVDGVTWTNISGEVNWRLESFALPAGTHLLTWTYSKDDSDSAGLDAGWVDQVAFTLPILPSILSQPTDQTVPPDDTASFTVEASGSPPPTYRWRFNGTDLNDAVGRVVGAQSNRLAILNAQSTDSGVYSVAVSNAYGWVLSSNAVLTVLPGTSLSHALNATNLTWQTGGDSAWLPQTNVTHDGAKAARSGAITNSQQSWLETTVTGPGTLTYWWKVSSESGYDFLEFYLDGVLQSGRISGTVDWQQKTNSIAAGAHTVRWRYVKDSSRSSGQDTAWLDEVFFVTASQAPQIVTQPVSRTNVVGSTATFSVTATGTSPLSYQWRENGTNLVNGGTISGVMTSNLTVVNVQANDTGSYSVVVTNVYGSVTSSVAALMLISTAEEYHNPIGSSLGESSALGDDQFLGARFVISEDVQVTSVAAELTYATGSFFAALVPLDSLSSLPIGDPPNGVPFNPGEVLAHQTFSVNASTPQIVTIPLSTELPPGVCGLVIGSGFYGTSGSGSMPTYAAVSGSSSFFWSSSPWRWQDAVIPGFSAEAWNISITVAFQQTPTITTHPQSRTNIVGSTATFTVAANGSPPLAYQWRKSGTNLVNDGAIAGVTTPTLTIASVQTNHAGNYSVVVTDAAGSVTSIVAVLTVEPLPYTYTTNNGAITIAGYTGPGGAATIPNTINGLPVTSLGDHAFYFNSSLTNITIPESVTNIGSSVFYACSILTAITVDTNNPAYSSEAGVLFNKSQTTLIQCPGGKAGNYRIPNSVTNIGYYALTYCRSLTSVTIPNSVTRIQSHAFRGCSGLTSVSIPSSVSSIGYAVFADCSSLTGITVDTDNPVYSSVDGVLFNKSKTVLIAYPGGKAGATYAIPNTVISIGVYALADCTRLTNVTIPSSVTSIQDLAFDGCSSLTSLTIPNSVATIENDAFQGCSGLTSVVIPYSVTRIGQVPFNLCIRLASISVDALNPVYSSVAGVLFNKSQTMLIEYPLGIARTSYTIPSSVTSIGHGAFWGCSSLTNITAGNSVTNIGDYAFSYCSGLTGVYFQGNAPSLGGGSVFSGANVTVYYLAGTAGWGSTFGGRPTALWNSPPAITAQPSSRTNLVGTTATFTVIATGSEPLSYQWQFNQTNLPGATSATLTLTNVQITQAGTYRVVVTNNYGSVISSNALLKVLDLGEALNATSLVWTTGGNAAWFAQTSTSHDGAAAAQSGAITNSQQSWLETTVNGPGTLMFWWRVSSETNCDFLALSVDQSLQARISGEVGWQKQTCYLAPGSHTVRWAYSKDGSISRGQDAGWVDEVSYTPGTTPPVITSFASQTASVGQDVNLCVTAVGAPPLSYQWQFRGSNVAAATASCLYLANAQAASAGTYTVVVTNQYGVVSSNATLTVNPAAPSITMQPRDTVAARGGYASFGVTARGSEPLSYLWQFNGTAIAEETRAVLALTNVQFSQMGNYSVVVSNAYGFVVSSNALLTVVPQQVIAWGDNSYGQTNVPAELGNVTAVEGGDFHSLALRADGSLVAWGSGPAASVPAALSNVVAIAAGRVHNLALRADGTVAGWGRDYYGPATAPVGLSNVVAIAAGYAHSLALRADGSVVAWGLNDRGQTNIPSGLCNAVAVSAGGNHSLALRADGTVVSWGSEDCGQTVIPAGLSNVTAAVDGGCHSLALRADGTVVAWGYNASGQATAPTGLSNVVAIAGGGAFSLALRQDGTVVAWGDNSYHQTNSPSNLSNVVEIAGGTGHGLALAGLPPGIAPPVLISKPFVVGTLGRELRFGIAAMNGVAHYGASGLPSGLLVDSVTGLISGVPTEPGAYSVALSATNTLGAAQQMVTFVINSPLPGISGPSTVITGIGTSFTHQVLPVNDAVFLAATGLPAGFAFDTQRGIVSGKTHILGDYPVVVTVSNRYGIANSSFTIRVSSVMGWGYDHSGLTLIPPGLSNVVALAAGGAPMDYFFSLALTVEGRVMGWGDNRLGQLSIPDGLSNAVAVAAGAFHSLALLDDGTVSAWGYNREGQCDVPLGLSNVLAIAAGGCHSVALTAEGRVIGWGENAFGQLNTPAGLSNVVAIAAGGMGEGYTAGHTLALTKDGRVIAWGVYYATNVPNGLSNVVAIAAGGGNSLALTAAGRVVGWGDNYYGAITVPAGLSNVVAVAAGGIHSLALTAEGKVVGWGDNYYGTTNVPVGLSNVVAIAGSMTHNLALISGSGIARVIQQPRDQVDRAERTVSFKVLAAGATPVTYQWRCCGTNLPVSERMSGVTTSALTISNLQAGDAGFYSVVVSNAYGLATSHVALLTVLPPNRAPVLQDAAEAWLPAINENEFDDWGTTVEALLDPLGTNAVADADADTIGIAITAVNEANGTWQYMSFGDYQWQDIGPATAASALLLGPQANIRFVPARNFFGSVSPGFVFRAWDQTSGSEGGFGDATENGRSSAFSSVTGVASISVDFLPPPPNDYFADRILLNGAILTTWGSTVGATSEAGEPFHGSYFAPGKSVWWVWSPPTNGIYVIEAEGRNVYGAYLYGVVAVYTGSSLSNLVSLGRDILDGPANNGMVCLEALAGTEYLIVVDGQNWPVSLSPGSENVLLTVEPGQPAPQFLAEPADQTVFVGEYFFLQAKAVGVGPLAYQWRINGTNIGGATNSHYYKPATSQQVGKYTLVVTNAFGTITSRTAQVSVLPTPQGIVLLSPTILSDGAFTLEVYSPSNFTAVLQASTNLSTWIVLQTNSLTPGSRIQFLDPEARNCNRRFYRVVSP